MFSLVENVVGTETFLSVSLLVYVYMIDSVEREEEARSVKSFFKTCQMDGILRP